MNAWQSVIARSRVNDDYYYDEERLPQFRWEWPKGTWFQVRLEYAREHAPVWSLKSASRSLETDAVLPH
jgi:hypothetical protein